MVAAILAVTPAIPVTATAIAAAGIPALAAGTATTTAAAANPYIPLGAEILSGRYEVRRQPAVKCKFVIHKRDRGASAPLFPVYK